MDMVKLHSIEDMLSLPVTSWNIQQPAGEWIMLLFVRVVYHYNNLKVSDKCSVLNHHMNTIKFSKINIKNVGTNKL